MNVYKMKLFVARDKDGMLCAGNHKPSRDDEFESWICFGDLLVLPRDMFPDLEYTDEPIEAEITIKRTSK